MQQDARHLAAAHCDGHGQRDGHPQLAIGGDLIQHPVSFAAARLPALTQVPWVPSLVSRSRAACGIGFPG